MVKGISRQVIVVQSPDPKLFEQAIFIIKDDVIGQEGVTDEALLKEAKRLIGTTPASRNRFWAPGLLWAVSGALLTGIVWLVSAVF